MKYSTIPRVSARPRRTANPYFPHAVRSKHKPHRIAIEGMCAYCGKRRADSRDHVVPRSVLRTYNATAPIDAPSVPAKWLVEVGCCLTCNWLKANSRLVPPSWRRQVAAMNRFFGGTEWRTWAGDPRDPALKAVHL